MSDHEDLRAALIELEKLRLRERAASHENATLLRALDQMSRAGSSDKAASLLVAICAEALGADFAALVVPVGQKGVSFSICSRDTFAGLTWGAGADLLARPFRMVDLHKRDWGAPVPEQLTAFHALLTVPLKIDGEGPMALIAMAHAQAQFSAADLNLLGRVAAMAGQALAAKRLARRNSVLAGLIDGSLQPTQEHGSFLDAPLEAVSRAFDRLTEAQGVVVALNNDLLRAPSDQIDSAIHKALARTGEITGADRVYVFRCRAPRRMDNTHEWVADGTEPMIDHLQDMPEDFMETWLHCFSKDHEVYIPSVADMPDDDPVKKILAEQEIKSLLAVPMILDGQIMGFLGYDAVRETRSFLPGEVFLLRSVGNTINAVLERRHADQRAETASSALLAERNRMQATLNAMPDLVLELDATGRFTGYHQVHNQQFEAIAQRLVGHTPDSALPREGADIAWRIMREVDATGRTEGHEFRFDLPDRRHWFQISAAARRGGEAYGGYVFVIRDITDARAQRREIERLSEVARRTTNLVIVSDTEGRIEWVNPAFERRSGWSLEEIRGRKPGSFLQSEKTDPDVRREIAEALRALTPFSAEILNVSRGGQEYWVNLDIQPLFDGEGKHKGFMAVQSDVTERRAQAERLEETTALALNARQRLQSAVEALKDGFALYDSDSRLVLCNQPHRDFFPKSGPLIREGMTYLDILKLRLEHREYKGAIGHEQEWLEKGLKERRKPYNMSKLALQEWAEKGLKERRKPYSETEHELADGRWVRAFEKATPDGGRVELRVDITALKEAERRAINERAAAMDASHDGIAITNAEGHFIYMNPSHRMMFGVPEEEDVRALHWSSLYTPPQADWVRNSIFPILKRNGSWQGDLCGNHRDGSSIDQEVSLTLQEDGGIVCISRDIADRRRGDAERARLREELQLAQRREVIGQLAAGLAHDFNNILAVISGSAGLLEARLAAQQADTQEAARILQAASRAAKLVARLRDLGKQGSVRQQLDLRKPLYEAADLLRAGFSGVHNLVVHAPQEPLEAMADPTDILQLLLNLGINARDALDDGPNEIAVTLASADLNQMQRPPDIGVLRDEVEYIMLRVEDTGPGIDADIRMRIFEPYFTSKGQHGTGLGLAIVAGVVRGNSAALWFDSTLGVGTQVTVFWPVAQEQTALSELATPEDEISGLDGVQVLVVDDEEEVCTVLGAILEAAGAEVATATDPRDAFEAIIGDPGHWHVLITDHDMPHMTGSALAQSIYADAPELSVILISALPDKANDDRRWFKEILQKPVDARQLVRVVAKEISSRKFEK